MRRSMIDTIFMSEKRKNLMLLLRNGPKTMIEVLEVLDVTRHALLPQIKILSENGLVVKEKDVCRLSEIGSIVVEDMVPLISTLIVLEENYDYWTEHELDAIPPQLLRRIGELRNCKMVEPDINDMFELNKDMIVRARESNFIMGATAFLHPSFPSFILDLVKSDIDVSIILAKNALEKHKVAYGKELDVFLHSVKGKLYVYPEHMKLASLFIAEEFLMICLFDKSGKYDRKDLVFCSADALNWGLELFEHYLTRSYRITGL
ncbi:MAG: winged helix-turn-helix domain-containing protein [Methanolobus sp.]|nr:winged helix-turn-helix domain-containing protein [Methanolobus sp.]